MPASTETLRRDVRWLKAYALATTLGFALLALTAARAPTATAELTVERLNVVDPAGVTRLVIANAERFPLPRVGGREHPRAVQPAGIVFYDAKGSEIGGLALTDASMGRVSALAFDYPNYDAVALVTRVAPDGKDASAGLLVNSRAPPGLDVSAAARVVKRRIAVQNENENAEVLLADAQGRDRIRLRVDAAGDARIEVLDAQGKVVFRAPNG